jgi:hypothetical protein
MAAGGEPIPAAPRVTMAAGAFEQYSTDPGAGGVRHATSLSVLRTSRFGGQGIAVDGRAGHVRPGGRGSGNGLPEAKYPGGQAV